ncbi:TPA: hypothetical protein SMI57_001356 [Serratia liquefaciens]|nr:hypothetical protein [Serratia liquefaciens]
MLESFITDKSKDLLLIIFLTLAVIRVGGFSFLFRLILKLLKIEFTHEKLKKQNQKTFEAQMYRFINGINIQCVEDGALIEENIESGKIQRSSFWFTGFFGPIGYKRLVRIELLLIGSIFFICIILGAALLYNSISDYKKGYVHFNLADEEIYISTENIYDKNKNKTTTKDICNTQKESLSNTYIEACSYLPPTSEEKSKELNEAIETEKKNTKLFELTGFIFIFIAVLLLLGFLQYISLNKKICDIKDNLK